MGAEPRTSRSPSTPTRPCRRPWASPPRWPRARSPTCSPRRASSSLTSAEPGARAAVDDGPGRAELAGRSAGRRPSSGGVGRRRADRGDGAGRGRHTCRRDARADGVRTSWRDDGASARSRAQRAREQRPAALDRHRRRRGDRPGPAGMANSSAASTSCGSAIPLGSPGSTNGPWCRPGRAGDRERLGREDVVGGSTCRARIDVRQPNSSAARMSCGARLQRGSGADAELLGGEHVVGPVGSSGRWGIGSCSQTDARCARDGRRRTGAPAGRPPTPACMSCALERVIILVVLTEI